MKGRCVLEQIQIKNIRSLKDTGLIKLCPINVLVGNNSSGKSTFLRTFPLIKQSISKYTDGPILWAGDVDDYVDFGSFKETITNDKSSDSIELTFIFDPKRIDALFAPFYFSFPTLKNTEQCNEERSFDTRYSLVIKSKGNAENCGEYVSKVIFQISTHVLEIQYSVDGQIDTVSLDGVKILLPPAEDDGMIRYGYYLTRSYFYTSTTVFGTKLPQYDSKVDDLRSTILPWFDRKGKGRVNIKSDRTYFSLIYVVGELLCRNVSVTELSQKYKDLYDIRESDSEALTREIAVVEQRLKGYNDAHRDAIVRDFLFIYFCAYLPDINKYLSDYFGQVHYIAPVRATAERYYRLRNTAIDDIDHQGKNLAIFLNSLSKERLHAFQAWTTQHFGFKIFVQRESGHLSVNVELQKSTGRFNLSDTGFGYSQILPIITQLWMLSTKEKSTHSSTPLIVAIEQPELHLHPSLQAKLAKVFIASIQLALQHGYQLQLILETHSETIVNYFGSAIARGELSPNDISVILFDKCFGCPYTDVRVSSYDDSGYLKDWPIGFLSAGE